MEFEWDADKARTNVDRHGVAFAEALTVFGVPLKLPLLIPTIRWESIGS